MTLRRKLSTWVQGHPAIAFPVVYLGWAYLFWTPALLSETSVWSMPNLLWFLVGGASPLLAGLLLASLDGGSRRVKEIFRTLVDWRRIPGRWWLPLLSFWLLFDLSMAAIALLVGVTDAPLDVRWNLFQQLKALSFLLLLSFVFPAVEEFGLRGYYLERLQASFHPVTAALVNGATWALWHAPFVGFAGYYANTSFHPELYWWLPMIVCHTLLISLVYNGTRSSLLAVLVFHGMMNFTGEVLGISPDMYPFMLTGTLLVAVFAALRLSRVAR